MADSVLLYRLMWEKKQTLATLARSRGLEPLAREILEAAPAEHRHLIVRVAGYSDYFCDLSSELQEEIITRTEHEAFQNQTA